MFFFEDKVEVKFNVRPTVKDNFEQALKMLGKSDEEAFEEFTSLLISQALKGEQSSDIQENDYSLKRLPLEIVVHRIQKWSINPKGMPFKMLKAFLTVSDITNYGNIYEGVDRIKVAGYFMEFANCDHQKFESIFRQMCSAAPRAYGDVFEYERAHGLVYLNKKYSYVVETLKNNFLE